MLPILYDFNRFIPTLRGQLSLFWSRTQRIPWMEGIFFFGTSFRFCHYYFCLQSHLFRKRFKQPHGWRCVTSISQPLQANPENCLFSSVPCNKLFSIIGTETIIQWEPEKQTKTQIWIVNFKTRQNITFECVRFWNISTFLGNFSEEGTCLLCKMKNYRCLVVASFIGFNGAALLVSGNSLRRELNEPVIVGFQHLDWLFNFSQKFFSFRRSF